MQQGTFTQRDKIHKRTYIPRFDIKARPQSHCPTLSVCAESQTSLENVADKGASEG